MIGLINEGHSFDYETEKLCRTFFPTENIVIGDADAPSRVTTYVCENDGGTLVGAYAVIGSLSASAGEKLVSPGEKELELALGRCVYRALSRICGFGPPWGVLTGVRPAKLYYSKLTALGEKGAAEYFADELLVGSDKIALCRAAAERRREAEIKNSPDSFSLYVSIPFCPSRCSYCSFVSHSIANAGKLLEPYFELLLREIAYCGELARNAGLRLRTVYVGGGTPGILSARDIDRLCRAVTGAFDVADLLEFTFEAGRPDVLDDDKLAAIASGPIDRISINPQTLGDGVLARIGRAHSVRDFYDAMDRAAAHGIGNINCDLIAGLPGDDAEGFLSSVGGVLDLAPRSLTLHSFALKSASEFVTDKKESVRGDRDLLSPAYSLCRDAGYSPYYLYRQSKSVGCGENTGLCLDGGECLYNIYMMDEIHSVIAVGAGAVTKLRDPRSDHIERVFSLKYPYEYVRRFDEMLDRKKRIASFYAERR